MNTPARIFAMLVWLGGLAVAGSIILTITASRVGEHKSSTYGNAYVQFQNSWGGEIGIIPPEFSLQRTYMETQFNSVSEQYEDIVKTEQIALVPKSVKIDSNVNYGEQERDFLVLMRFKHKIQIHM